MKVRNVFGFLGCQSSRQSIRAAAVRGALGPEKSLHKAGITPLPPSPESPIILFASEKSSQANKGNFYRVSDRGIEMETKISKSKALIYTLVGATCVLALSTFGLVPLAGTVLDSTFSFGESVRAAVSYQTAELSSFSGPEVLGWQLDAVRSQQVALARFLEQHQVLLQLLCGTLFLLVLLGGAHPVRILQRRVDEFLVFCAGAAWRPAANLALVVTVSSAGIAHLSVTDRETDRSRESVVPAAWAAIQPLGSSGSLAFASRAKKSPSSRAALRVELSPKQVTAASQQAFRNWVHSHSNRDGVSRSTADIWRSASRIALRSNDRQGLLRVLYDSPHASRKAKAVLHLQHLVGEDREVTVAFQDLLERNEDALLTSSVLSALSQVRDPEVVATVARIAQDARYWKVRSDAAKCLASMGTEQSIESLCQIAQTDEDPQVRLRVSEILGRYEPQQQIVDVLAKVAHADKEEMVRYSAVEALSNQHQEIRLHRSAEIREKIQNAMAKRILEGLQKAKAKAQSEGELIMLGPIISNVTMIEAKIESVSVSAWKQSLTPPVDESVRPDGYRLVGATGRSKTTVADMGSEYDGKGKGWKSFNDLLREEYLNEKSK